MKQRELLEEMIKFKGLREVMALLTSHLCTNEYECVNDNPGIMDCSRCWKKWADKRRKDGHGIPVQKT